MPCPGPTSPFVSSFGAPRSGHTHQGVDMMAADGTPIYAPESGTYRTHGNDSFYLHGASGTTYFGTHLQGHARGDGPVTAGELVAYVGHSGNASASAPHLHFEIHPSGGPAIDPYPATSAACSGPSPEVLAAVRYVAEVGAPPSFPFTRLEVQRWYNHLYDPNIGVARAQRLADYMNGVVEVRLGQYLLAVYLSRVQSAQHSDLVWRWQGVAECESGGNWATNTGNGYYGGVQFLLSTWRSVGGQGYPHENSPGEQAYRAEILKDRSGLGQWPVCGRNYRG